MDYSYDDDYDIHPEEYDYDLDHFGNYFEADELPVQSLHSTFETCIKPSIEGSIHYIVALIGWCWFARIIHMVVHRTAKRQLWLQHLVSVSVGIALLYTTGKGAEFLIVIFLSLAGFTLLLIINYWKWNNIGVIVMIVTISSHFVYEALWQKPEAWQRIRGIQMVVSMKIISLAFDLETEFKDTNEAKKKSKPAYEGEPKTDDEKRRQLQTHYASIPGLVPYLGYILCPSTCILGPWIPYKTYIHGIKTPPTDFISLLRSLINASLALLFLSLSNCITTSEIISSRDWSWFAIYRDALTVRSSHYFICFLSQATLSAGGIVPMFGSNNKPNAVLGHLVTRPWRIEYPTSLSEVVRNWNIPMHDWLKSYTFRAIYKRYGNYMSAIFLTYLVSSLLHGFHLKIYAVLLSLACFAYVENILRSKLANIFNCCIAVTHCQKPCRYLYCPTKEWNIYTCCVVITNFLFVILNMMHLAYLGIMMLDNDEGHVNYFSLNNVFGKWAKLNYLNHWSTLFIYVFHNLI